MLAIIIVFRKRSPHICAGERHCSMLAAKYFFPGTPAAPHFHKKLSPGLCFKLPKLRLPWESKRKMGGWEESLK